MMTGNIDDHSKNFSFMLSSTDGWHITPAYDLTFTTDLNGMTIGNRHEMSILGKTTDITVDDMIRFADINNIKNPMTIIEKVSYAVSKFRDLANKNMVTEFWIDRIEKHLCHLVLPAYVDSMQGFRPTIIEDYEIAGKKIKHCFLKENEKHDYTLYADIVGKPHRKVFKKNGKENKEIRNKGGVKMSADNLKELIRNYTSPKI